MVFAGPRSHSSRKIVSIIGLSSAKPGVSPFSFIFKAPLIKTYGCCKLVLSTCNYRKSFGVPTKDCILTWKSGAKTLYAFTILWQCGKCLATVVLRYSLSPVEASYPCLILFCIKCVPHACCYNILTDICNTTLQCPPLTLSPTIVHCCKTQVKCTLSHLLTPTVHVCTALYAHTVII